MEMPAQTWATFDFSLPWWEDQKNGIGKSDRFGTHHDFLCIEVLLSELSLVYGFHLAFFFGSVRYLTNSVLISGSWKAGTV